MQLIDGKAISAQIKDELKTQVEQRIASGKKIPHLAAIIVGNDPASETYVAHKVKACEQAGFQSTLKRLNSDITQAALLAEIDQLNNNADIDGVIVQLPLPDHISEEKIINYIHPAKDVDGFHPESVGRMVTGQETYLPATPAGIMELLKRYNIPTEGKHCVILGRSNIVGTPMALLMSRKGYPGNATVTLCHSRTKNLKEIVRQADIVIAAIGKMHFVTEDMIQPGAVVIDVGIHRVPSDKTRSGWKLHGDVDFQQVKEKAAYMTPVPGGVGPMTIVSLLQNTLKAANRQG